MALYRCATESCYDVEASVDKLKSLLAMESHLDIEMNELERRYQLDELKCKWLVALGHPELCDIIKERMQKTDSLLRMYHPLLADTCAEKEAHVAFVLTMRRHQQLAQQQTLQGQEQRCELPLLGQDQRCEIPLYGQEQRWELPLHGQDQRCEVPVRGQEELCCEIPVHGQNQRCELPLHGQEQHCELPLHGQEQHCELPLHGQKQHCELPLHPNQQQQQRQHNPQYDNHSQHINRCSLLEKANEHGFDRLLCSVNADKNQRNVHVLSLHQDMEPEDFQHQSYRGKTWKCNRNHVNIKAKKRLKKSSKVSFQITKTYNLYHKVLSLHFYDIATILWTKHWQIFMQMDKVCSWSKVFGNKKPSTRANDRLRLCPTEEANDITGHTHSTKEDTTVKRVVKIRKLIRLISSREKNVHDKARDTYAKDTQFSGFNNKFCKKKNDAVQRHNMNLQENSQRLRNPPQTEVTSSHNQPSINSTPSQNRQEGVPSWLGSFLSDEFIDNILLPSQSQSAFMILPGSERDRRE